MYEPASSRYDEMTYARCGRSGLELPRVSLGLWHNFGGVDRLEEAKSMLRRAFDLGITHFDLANNYGPPPGSAEQCLGRMLREDFRPHRDELVISTKAGYWMWDGPYGDGGSRKYLVSSIDQSLRRLGLEYVDIFYHHRPDPKTPLAETMGALDHIVRSGRALYVGISNYTAEQTRAAADLLDELGTPCLIHQPKYNMFERWIERDLLATLRERGIGSIVFSPLAQGLLTNKYLKGIPDDSRIAKPHGFLKKEALTRGTLTKVRALNAIAAKRSQKLAQMAVAWVLRHPEVTSAVIGASSVEQIDDAVAALKKLAFDAEELAAIDAVLASDN